MRNPKNWQDCVVIGRGMNMLPQEVARAYSVKAPKLFHEVQTGHSNWQDAELALLDACDAGLDQTCMYPLLNEMLDKHARTYEDCDCVRILAKSLGYDHLSGDAIRKMVELLPSE